MKIEVNSAVPKTNPGTAVVLLYAFTLTVSAFLLFVVQPLFSRMALPNLGGSPAVWNTCVMWFQTVLLLGYVYGHVLTRTFTTRKQVYVHLAVLLTAYFALPIQDPAAWVPPDGSWPVPWLLARLTLAIGLPFFGVCTTAPLLQRWFSWTSSAKGNDPYFLYSASNVGGLLALASYSIVIEPALGLRAQGTYWSWSYGLLVVLIACCGFTMLRNSRSGRQEQIDAPVGRLAWTTRLRWLACSLVPSGLLLGVTLHITTDIAPVTFLWLLPLGLYTLSFVLVFAQRKLLKHEWMIVLQIVLLISLAVLWRRNTLWLLAIHLAAFFATAMVCHGELARSRPETAHLTEFYLWISGGGLLGSILTVLIAPTLFDSVLEYPLLLIAACFLRPPAVVRSLRPRWEIVLGIVLIEVYALAAFSGSFRALVPSVLLYGAIGAALYLLAGRRLSLATGVTILIFAPPIERKQSEALLYQERTFYGVYRVTTLEESGFNFMYHGTTIHGGQSKDAFTRRDPFLYFYKEGPLGQLFAALEHEGRPISQIGVAGLGVGGIASYRTKPGQHLTYFEIDPAVERLARDSRFFTYLQDAGANVNVVVGDARLSLGKIDGHRFDVLILDAFSSDGVPIHLMTREAVDLYLQKLSEHGLLVFNISNRYLRLERVLSALAADAGMVASIQNFVPTKAQARKSAMASNWVVMARTREDLGAVIKDPRWQPLVAGSTSTLWTDDYAGLFPVVIWPSWLGASSR